MSDNTVNSSSQAGGVYNLYNDDHVNIGDLALQVGLETMEAYDSQVQAYYQQVHQENIDMQNMNNAMEAANTAASNPPGKESDCTFTYTDPTTGQTSQMSVKDYMDQQGMQPPSDPDNYYSKDEWSLCEQNLKTASDSISSENQEDMMKLQSALNKDNAAAQQASDIMSKSSQTEMAIIGNLR